MLIRLALCLSAVALLLATSVHAGVPVFTEGTPSATRVTASSLHINVRLDTQGFYYWVLLAKNAVPPSSKQVKAGVNAVNGKPILKGGQQVTTTTLVFTDVVFKGLNYTTTYDLYVVAEDQATPPNIQSNPTLVRFTTLEGRKTFLFYEGHSQGNRLGVGDVHDHWTPVAVPTFANMIVNEESQFATMTNANGRLFNFGDIWNARMTWGTQNEEFDASRKQAWLSAGGNHWLGVIKKQCLSFGKNDNGRLGLGDLDEHLTATAVPGYNNVVQASAGLEFSMILENNTVAMFGRNNFGQLGTGDLIDRWTPTEVVGLHRAVTRIAAGRDHAMFLQNRQLYTFGSNRFGQLGLGDTIDRLTPTLVPGYNNISLIAGGNYFSMFVQNGQLYTFGYNYQTAGAFKGYSPHNIKCYEQHSAGCFDVGKPSPNLDDPSHPFNDHP